MLFSVLQVIGVCGAAAPTSIYISNYVFCSVFHSNVLQWNLKLLMSGVDMLHMDTFRLVQYEKKQGQIRQEKQKFLQKRVCVCCVCMHVYVFACVCMCVCVVCACMCMC